MGGMDGWGVPTEYLVVPVLNWTGLGCDKKKCAELVYANLTKSFNQTLISTFHASLVQIF